MTRFNIGKRSHSKRGKRGRWILPAVLLILVTVLAAFSVRKVADWLNGPEDYEGQGSGTTVVEIGEGSDGRDIAHTLNKADVVKSADAFYELSLEDKSAQSIRPGFYKLREQMSAKWALRELSDDGNRVEGKVVVTEGARIDQIVDEVDENTDIEAKDLTAALKDPSTIGLPPEAKKNPEGYLFPATYIVEPGTSAEDLLGEMVHKTKQVEQHLKIDKRAKARGLNKEEVLTMASIIEYEANRSQDYPKVARVLFNRLDEGMKLQLDSTVSYISEREGDVWTTEKERQHSSKFNTYKHKGLPPGPIGSPGKATIEAVLKPAKGDWLYFVPDFQNDSTVFSTTWKEHQKAVDRAKDYCRKHDDC